MTRSKQASARRLETLRRGRTLTLVDIENLAGDPRPEAETVAEVRTALSDLGLVDRASLVVTACNHGAVLAVADGWPCARHLVRSGRDGADKALLEVASGENVVQRFDRVVLASGDGAFATVAAALAAAGVTVVAVSRPDALSARLRLAVHEVRLLSAPPTRDVPPAVAA